MHILVVCIHYSRKKEFILSMGILAQALEPKTIKWETLGLCPWSASSGVAPNTDLWDTLFYMYEAQVTASTQREGVRFFAWKRHVSISFNDRCFLLATPFYCGVYGTKCSIQIPSYSKYCWKYLLMYSPPLSDLMDLIFFLKLFSIRALKTSKILNTSDFYFTKYTQQNIEQSSIK